MFVGLGTVINVGAIILGSTVGIIGGSRFPEKLKILITDVLGCVTLIIAADNLRSVWNHSFVSAVPKGWTTLGTLAALILGGVVGYLLHIEDRLENFGVAIKTRFGRDDKGSFLDGFMTASLLFAIGPLAILGSISDGMHTGIQQLVLKSTLDGFAAMAFATTFGWGVAFSAIPVAIYQFSWTAIGYFLGNILTQYQIQSLTATGGVLLFGIGLRLLNIKFIAIGDLLPALIFAPLVALAAHQFI
jgi:uncharacterized membrane protein YqgA involved in biofilm formation